MSSSCWSRPWFLLLCVGWLMPGLASAQPAPSPDTHEAEHRAGSDDPGLAPPPGDPAPPSEVSWFYVRAGRKAGPVSTEALRRLVASGQVASTTKVWRVGMVDWQPLRTQSEFAGLTPPPVPHEPAPAAPAPAQPLVNTQDERIRSRGLIISGSIIFGVTWGAAMFTAILLADDKHDDETMYREVLWIPVAGPLAGYLRTDWESTRGVVLSTMWTLGQAAGLTLLIVGAVGKKNPDYRPTSFLSPDGWQIMPLAGSINGLGLGRSW